MGLNLIVFLIIFLPKLLLRRQLLLPGSAFACCLIGCRLILRRGISMTESLLFVPSSTSEIGERHSSTAIIHAQGTKFSQSAPLCQIIDINVERQTVLQTIHQSGIHRIVHASMTELAAQVAELFQGGMGSLYHRMQKMHSMDGHRQKNTADDRLRCFWSECRDSNSGPLEPHSSTLPTALHPDIGRREKVSFSQRFVIIRAESSFVNHNFRKVESFLTGRVERDKVCVN